MKFNTAIITGAGRGLGRALALQLSQKGTRVALVARNQDELAEVQSQIKSQGGLSQVYAIDVADKSQIYPLIQKVSEELGEIDLLINNASTLGPSRLELLLDTQCEDLERTLAVNLIAPFRLSKVVLGAMLLRRKGVVLNISSDAAVSAYPEWGVYSASKAALDHLTRIWGAELDAIPLDLRPQILSVDPGEMNTQMHAQALPAADPNTLTDPAIVAQRIIHILNQVEKIPNGARLIASEYGN